MEIISNMQEKEECIICLDEIEKEWKELECNHRYHRKCIDQWATISNRCPVCMKNIHESKIERKYLITALCFVIFMLLVIIVLIMMVLFS